MECRVVFITKPCQPHLSFVNAVTFGKLLRMGLVAPETNQGLENENFQSCPPTMLGSGKGLEVE